jgi:hypothetical protein
MRVRSFVQVSVAFVVVLGLLAAGCGGKSPASPNGGLALQGVVLNGSSATSSDVAKASANSSRIKVTVEGLGLETIVSANGTFAFEGLAPGTFTLVFSKDGVVLGSVTITVTSGTEVKVVVEIKAGGVILVSLKIDDEETATDSSCMISGGKQGQSIELEGLVSSGTAAQFKLDVSNRASGLVDVNAAGASFNCVGQSGNDCKATLTAGARVHVRGTLTTCTSAAATVTASEVKVQKP